VEIFSAQSKSALSAIPIAIGSAKKFIDKDLKKIIRGSSDSEQAKQIRG